MKIRIYGYQPEYAIGMIELPDELAYAVPQDKEAIREWIDMHADQAEWDMGGEYGNWEVTQVALDEDEENDDEHGTLSMNAEELSAEATATDVYKWIETEHGNYYTADGMRCICAKLNPTRVNYYLKHVNKDAREKAITAAALAGLFERQSEFD